MKTNQTKKIIQINHCNYFSINQNQQAYKLQNVLIVWGRLNVSMKWMLKPLVNLNYYKNYVVRNIAVAVLFENI